MTGLVGLVNQPTSWMCFCRCIVLLFLPKILCSDMCEESM